MRKPQLVSTSLCRRDLLFRSPLPVAREAQGRHTSLAPLDASAHADALFEITRGVKTTTCGCTRGRAVRLGRGLPARRSPARPCRPTRCSSQSSMPGRVPSATRPTCASSRRTASSRWATSCSAASSRGRPARPRRCILWPAMRSGISATAATSGSATRSTRLPCGGAAGSGSRSGDLPPAHGDQGPQPRHRLVLHDRR